MNSIVTVGTSVNESTQSIHALIEEMTEATGCVSQAMGDITVSMGSTVASIQEQASMTGRIQDIIAIPCRSQTHLPTSPSLLVKM